MNEKVKMSSPCGLPCFACVIHLAKFDDKIRTMVADKLGIPKEKAECDGCRNHEGHNPVINPNQQCQIYACAKDKGVDFCSYCDEFPCERFQPYADKADFLPHNTKVYNLCLIKKHGAEKWADEMGEKVYQDYFSKTMDFNNVMY
ncbi:DUF3795 domain-containing protein [Limisalsivibrio acetivorans]|uniref:DUF3795 domain-containing protein n=1 Tax=Limisalsivibrio acetivorans TaxID=1304888 RepID=UPI0003B5A124|nr:DUF3795 domain-containing protein [Limisalsivibrio acetivorans]